MNAPASLPSPVSPAPRRRRWPWVVGLCLAPFAVLGLAALSYLTLDREAAALRRHVMQASGSSWETKVQINVGGLTLGAVRAGLSVVRHANAETARLGLRAVNRASVGVYQRAAGDERVPLEKLLAETDRAMQQRGWSRLIGVTGSRETVLAYGPTRAGTGEEQPICLAVLKDRELVVVSAVVNADALADLVQRHLPADLKDRLHRELRTASR